MPTLVLQCGHENLRANMPTPEYRRGHGTPHLEKVIGPGDAFRPLAQQLAIGYDESFPRVSVSGRVTIRSGPLSAS